MSSGKLEIKTFVFFDIETTGLPQYEFNKTRITELSMMAADRTHLSNTNTGELPRVLHKLSLCIYPRKPITQGSFEITGLSNDLLEYQKPFDTNTVEMIRNFLSRLPSPVCLVAHNGNKFDFPILQKEIHRLNENLPENILCVDSFIILRLLHEQNIMPNNVGTPCLDITPLATTDENAVTMPITANVLMESLPDSIPISTRINNETTPKRSTSHTFIQESYVVRNERLKRHTTNARKCLFSPNSRISFKLGDIYERIYQTRAENSHRAEGDVLMLAHIAIACKNSFFKWCDAYATPFYLMPEI